MFTSGSLRRSFCAVSILLLGPLAPLPSSSAPMPIKMPVQVELDGQLVDIGSIIARQSANAADTIVGHFQVDLKGPDGKFLTVQQLEKRIGQDHLNWFQKVVDIDPPTIPMGAKSRFIDPPKGGYGANADAIGGAFFADNTWADERPWYWDEREPRPDELKPPGSDKEFKFRKDLQLSTSYSQDGTLLVFADAPIGQRGKTLTFQTFLISDYGNMTYDVLGKGFQWKSKIDALGIGEIIDIKKDMEFTRELQHEIEEEFAMGPSARWRRARKPESSESTREAPAMRLREQGPAGAVVTVQPTHNGRNILNADGSLVQYARSIPTGAQAAVFDIPGIINGKKVTDAAQFTGKGRDPGTLFFSVFDEQGMMTDEALSRWLSDRGFLFPHEFLMPDFFADSGFDEIFYGVDMDNLLAAGAGFVASHAFGDVFTVGSLKALLPGYTFSSTPLEYVPGQGWAGTPLADDVPLRFVAFHGAAAIPEPATLVLLLGGLPALCAAGRLARGAGPERGGRGPGRCLGRAVCLGVGRETQSSGLVSAKG